MIRRKSVGNRVTVVALVMGLCIFTLAFAGCKQRETSAVKEVGRPRSVLLVGFGGWNSCRVESDLNQLPSLAGFSLAGSGEINRLLTPQNSFTFSQLLNLAKTLTEAGIDVKWMSTCFFIGLPKDSSIWTLNSDGKKKSMPAADVTAAIEEYAGDRDIVLMGHSYGGWMSGAVASKMTKPVLGVFTLEAISGEFCPTGAAITTTGSLYPYCRRAPDSGQVDVAAALAHTKKWINIHLPAAGRELDIYSGPYQAPIENREIRYTNIDAGPFGNAHHLLGLGAETWDVICEATKKLLEVTPGCRSLNVDQWGRDRRR